MARKKLLTEGEIRQFMKLANLRPIAQKRLRELDYGARDMPPVADEDVPAPGEEVDVDVPGEEVEVEEPVGEVTISTEDGEKVKAAMPVFQKIADKVEGAEGVDEPMEDPMGDPMGAPMEDEPMEDEPMMEDERTERVKARARERSKKDPESYKKGKPFGVPDPEEEEESEVLPATQNPGPKRRKFSGEAANENRIVAEVAKRVSRRLQAENRKEQMADQLAERIMKRLTK